MLFKRHRLGLASNPAMGLVVIQAPNGVTIASAEVPADQVISVLKSWVHVLAPGTALILDGCVLSESDKKRLVSATGGEHVTTTLPPPPPPEVQIQDFSRSLHTAFDLIRQGEWELLQHVQQRTREMADEAVRQRALMHRCLQDCDAVDRSILATATTDRFSTRIVAASAGPRRLNTHDVLRGFQKILTGRQR